MEMSVKCSSEYPSLIKIIEALYVMVHGCTNAYARHRGYHVRLRFTETMDSREFSARLTIFSKRKSGYTALRLTVVECDEDDSAINLPLY